MINNFLTLLDPVSANEEIRYMMIQGLKYIAILAIAVAVLVVLGRFLVKKALKKKRQTAELIEKEDKNDA